MKLKKERKSNMTREEQIRSAASNLIISASRADKGTFAKDVFELGVKWADENPKSPWISVEERLPDRLPAKFANWSKEVFVSVKRGREYRAYVDKYSHIYKTWGVFGDEVTHWMPIPPLLKEELL
jgi:hypothetical protein